MYIRMYDGEFSCFPVEEKGEVAIRSRAIMMTLRYLRVGI